MYKKKEKKKEYISALNYFLIYTTYSLCKMAEMRVTDFVFQTGARSLCTGANVSP